MNQTGKCARTDLEVVVGLDIVASGIELLVVNLLNVAQSLSHLILPELTILVGRVTVRQRRQFLQLLQTANQRSAAVTDQLKFTDCRKLL